MKPGKMYKMGPDGALPKDTAPLAEDDLPPDLRKGAKPEVDKKLDELSDGVRKLNETLSAKQAEPAQPPVFQPPVLEIPREEKIAFMKSVISNKPYSKKFEVFGRGIKLTFRTLSTSELDAVSEAIVIQSSRIPYSNMIALAGAHMRYAMASSLAEVEFVSEEQGISLRSYPTVSEMYPDVPKKDVFYVKDSNGAMQKKETMVQPTPGQKVLWAAADKFADVSVPLYNVMFEKYQKFDAEVLQLTKEAGDPDFFQNGVDGPYF
jgi:uncharacterized pyridoxamine 5'-phosphate oxidase family protein